jgi:hypothetical protein
MPLTVLSIMAADASDLRIPGLLMPVRTLIS